ncbi:DUF4832 domain-containing protein [Flavobacterium channae]|uniref:DUF4832 domain-containing protein n=1 Tax=Flavobacterium channae TaxID=2897181 RepID=UPI001E4A8361|nr:DUF4832 domain-containing protein [Flavobacterium channae]UGS23090.1 DUF4832 domain-containing protein [Flavobacterium channae]
MKLIKSIAFYSAVALSLTMMSCEDDNSGDNSASNFVGLENYQTVEIADGETVVVEGRILASEATGEDRTFNLMVDPSTTHGAANYSVPATVTIPAGSKEGTYDVTIVGNSLVDGNKIVVYLETAEGVNHSTTYGTYSNGVLTGVGTAKSTFNLYRPCASVRARLSITFDNYPEETAWELYDADFNVIDSGGITGGAITGYAALGFADRSTFSVVKCLAPGEYTFVIYDDYGDGMYTSATVSGSFSGNNLNNGAVLFTGGGNFGSFSEHTFTIQ